MKRLIGFFIVLLTLFASKSYATHYAAIDVYYDYISPLNYRVHLVVYRDCTGASVGPTDFMCATSSSCGQNINFTVDTAGTNDPLNGDTLDQLCPNVLNQCQTSSSQFAAFQYFHYDAYVTLPQTCTDWKFLYTTCCRNTTNNLSGQPGISVYAELNNVARPINNSVRLTILPIPYVCQNQVTNYLNGPIDPDNDSVVFESITAQQNGNCTNGTTQSCPYQGTFNATNPLPTTTPPGFQIGAQTGVASFTPTALGKYVLAFRATEYDKFTGVKVGSVMRDVQISIVNCNAPAPLVQPATSPVFNNGITQQVNICPGNTVNFSVTGVSMSGSNNLYVYANNSLTCPGSTLTVSQPNGGSPNTATFSWTPTGNDIGPHTLIITFSDSTCTTSQPIVLKSFATILVNVLPGVSAGGPYVYCPGGLPIQLQATGPPEVVNWSWAALPGSTQSPNFSDTTISNPTASPSGTMDVVVTGLPNSNGCPNKDTVTLTVFPALTLQGGPDKYPCANDAISFTATVSNPGGVFSWTPNTYTSGSTSAATLNLTPLGTMGYQVFYTDPNGCKAIDSVWVYPIGVRPILGSYPSKNPVCLGESIQLFANASPQPCGKSANQCNVGSTSTLTLGTGTASNSTFSPFYRDNSSGYRTQYLILADELKAAGFTPGNIKGLTMDVSASLIDPNSDFSNNLNVKMGCTNFGSMSIATGFINGLTTVYTSSKFVPTYPKTTMTFIPSNYFYWDGKTNLVIEFCYSYPSSSGGNPTPVFSTPTPYSSVLTEASNAVTACNLVASATNSLIGSLRPNFTFDFCKTNTFNYSWTPATSFVNSTVENPIVKPGVITASGATFSVTVSSDTSLCSASTSITITTDMSGAVVASADNQHICAPGLVTLQANPGSTTPPVYSCGEQNAVRNAATNNTTVGAGTTFSGSSPFSYYPNSKYQYVLTQAMLNAAGITGNCYIDSLSLNVLAKSSTAPYRDLSILMGCTPSLNTGGSFLNYGANLLVYNNAAYNTTSGWNTFRFQTPFLWNGTSNIVVEICYNNTSFQPSFVDDDIAVTTFAGAQNYQQIGSGIVSGCSFPSTTSFLPFGYNASEYPTTRLYYTPVANKPFNYIWEPSLYVNDTTKQNTLAYVTAPTIYTVSLINKTGCRITDTAFVDIVNHYVNATPKDTSFCQGDAIKAYASGPDNIVAASYTWFPTTGITPTTGTVVTLNPSVTTQYYVVRSDVYNCKDTAGVKINIIPTPAVTITNGDTVDVMYDVLYNLNATGAYVYNWTPSWNFTNPNINNTTIQATETGLYYVYGLDSNSCGGKDSIWLNVIKENNLIMPTVFSPNGDGINDVYRIGNLRFEKIQSFKIYNRWGEEVYSSIDNNGWNGSYKGQPCNIDTYYYGIKVAYPNGTVKTLNGEFLLLR